MANKFDKKSYEFIYLLKSDGTQRFLSQFYSQNGYAVGSATHEDQEIIKLLNIFWWSILNHNHHCFRNHFL